jgi:hypothetical protein
LELDDESDDVKSYRRMIDTSALDVHALDYGATRTTAPRFDILSVLPSLKDRAKTAIRLHPRRLALDETLPRDVSKIGGDFLWPADEPWPVCEKHEIPWVGVLQLFQSDFPEFPFKPGTDLCQIFWCPTLEHGFGGAPDAVVRWRDSTSIGPLLETIPRPRFQTRAWEAFERRSTGYHEAKRLAEHFPDLVPPEHLAALLPFKEKNYAQTDCIPLACRIFPERIVEYPEPIEFLEEEAALLEAMPVPTNAPASANCDSLMEYYERDASVSPGTKLLGHPDWVQGPQYPRCPNGHEMEHIISFDSYEADSGAWQALEDRELAPRFREQWQDEPHRRAWYALSQPTYLSFGDAGRNYVFLCRQCPDWPTVTLLQCS